MAAFNVLFGFFTALQLHRSQYQRVHEDLRRISRFIRINAEGRGDLTQRLTRLLLPKMNQVNSRSGSTT